MSIEFVTNPRQEEEDKTLDLTLRPSKFDDFIGQNKLKDNLHILINAAKHRKEPIEHVLLHGSPGLGKTTLAHIIAKEMGANIRVTSGPAIERAGDLAAILSNLEEGDVLFIDEIHRLHKVIEEILYPAMEDFALDLVAGKGPAARTLRLDLPKFTIIGATTRMSLISAPLRERFGVHYKLNFYEESEIATIIMRSAKILAIEIDGDCAAEIARRARRTPRIANRLLKRVRDYAQVKNNGEVTCDMTKDALSLLEVDELGLDDVDRKILSAIIEKFKGGPVGVQTIAAATSEEQETIEEIHEPFLMQIGFLERTLRGRMVTERAYNHLGMKAPMQQSNLVT
ncbi:MAG: Holliday junction branch migration DNA helicase RuvB [Candidatus Kerfeldbacteria bacterium]